MYTTAKNSHCCPQWSMAFPCAAFKTIHDSTDGSVLLYIVVCYIIYNYFNYILRYFQLCISTGIWENGKGFPSRESECDLCNMYDTLALKALWLQSYPCSILWPAWPRLFHSCTLKTPYLFIYLLVSPYYNTQNYNKNKNYIHDYRQSDRNSVSQLLRARIRTYKHKKSI
jgi:hypothetical protein